MSDPHSCKEILLRTHKANETRNASELAFYQEQADLMEEAIMELTKLEEEESILTKRSKAATAANWSKGKHLLDQVATADREAPRSGRRPSACARRCPPDTYPKVSKRRATSSRHTCRCLSRWSSSTRCCSHSSRA